MTHTISPELLSFIQSISGNAKKAEETIVKLVDIIRDFRDRNEELLDTREDLQDEIDQFFQENQGATTEEVVEMLEGVGYIREVRSKAGQPAAGRGLHPLRSSSLGGQVTPFLPFAEMPSEIHPLAGPQLVVPADKANMVLNAANARWGSLYNALYSSNIIDPAIKDETKRRAAVVRYVSDFLDKIVPFEDASWNDVDAFILLPSGKVLLPSGRGTSLRGIERSEHDEAIHLNQEKEWIASSHSLRSAHRNDESVAIAAINKQGKEIRFANPEKLIGFNADSEGNITDFILENNQLKIEIKLDNEQHIADILLESALTYIIDLEDASISAPANKYESYRILKGIADGNLECEVRGQMRRIAKDTTYIDTKTGEVKTLKRTAFPLVRDVGPHMVADMDIIEVDGLEVPEKILDCFITSLLGMRYHVAPKMHGADEVSFNVELWNAINKAQCLPENANKIGIMNEEMRTNAQLRACIQEAKNIIFFTNTGFLDYTGSFIDLMMYAGPITPYRFLPSQKYKTEYEKFNVKVSLEEGVPQIGAGMWASIHDMAGLLKSKEAQVKGLTDTGWSPSPTAATIHAIAFHIFGDVREMQRTSLRGIERSEHDEAIHLNKRKEWIASSHSLRSAHRNDVSIKDLFSFPRLEASTLTPEEKLRNLDFAVHGLIAYAEPWVRRGIGCSGIKDLDSVALMEDRATARIKAAFVRNWLLHGVVTKEEVEDSISRMAEFVDRQNEGVEGYTSLRGIERSEHDEAIHTKPNKEWIASSHSLRSAHRNDGDAVLTAVYNLIFNPLNRKDSYVEPYFYDGYKRQQASA